jgi:hypothetical protein
MVAYVFPALACVVFGVLVRGRSVVRPAWVRVGVEDVPIIDIDRQVVIAVRGNDAHRGTVIVRAFLCVREPAVKLPVNQDGKGSV